VDLALLGIFMFKEFAIIAPTASGKTELSISLAQKLDAIILSLDSLSVYKYIDIASAKPTLKERSGIKHFGIDLVKPNKIFDVMLFINEYKKAKKYALKHNKNLIIVGGTSFYLKALIDGISKKENISKHTKKIIKQKLLNLEQSYKELYTLDKTYMQNIKPTDRYRIEKAWEIYIQNNITPSEYFKLYKPKPIIENLTVFQIETPMDTLRSRIQTRTKKMLQNGLIDEVILLEKKYQRYPNSMKSIGIKETLEYLDGKISKLLLQELISIHTGQLAKRQKTFNRSQFNNIIQGNLRNLENIILTMI